MCRKSHKIIAASPHFHHMLQRDPVGTHILDACPHLPWLDAIESAFELNIKNGVHISALKAEYDGYIWEHTLVSKKKSVIIVVDKCTKREALL